jgi:hypothetical protein
MMEAASTSIPEDSNLHSRRRENLKSHEEYSLPWSLEPATAPFPAHVNPVHTLPPCLLKIHLYSEMNHQIVTRTY